MRGLNRTMLIGRLGRDPELRTSERADAVWCTFTLATGRSRKSAEGWTEVTDWHRVKVFGTQAELAHRYLDKGALVAVEGSMVYDTWTGKDGVKRTSAVVMADRVTFLESRADRARRMERTTEAAAVAEAK